MHLSLSQAAKAANVSKSTISKYLKLGRLSYVEKVGDSYRIDPAELFRVFSQTGSQTGSQTQAPNECEPAETPPRTDGYAHVLEERLQGLKALIAEKERRIADLEADRDRLAQNYQGDRDRLLRVIEEQAGTMRMITDQTAKQAVQPPRSFMERLFGRRRPKTPAA
jgi:Helix-turn-helix domain